MNEVGNHAAGACPRTNATDQRWSVAFVGGEIDEFGTYTLRFAGKHGPRVRRGIFAADASGVIAAELGVSE